MRIGGRLLLGFPVAAMACLVGLFGTPVGRSIASAIDGAGAHVAAALARADAVPVHPASAEQSSATFAAILLGAVVALPGTWLRRLVRFALGVATLVVLDVARRAISGEVNARAASWSGPVHDVVWPALFGSATVALVLFGRGPGRGDGVASAIAPRGGGRTAIAELATIALLAAGAGAARWIERDYARVLAPIANALQDPSDPHRPGAIEAEGALLWVPAGPGAAARGEPVGSVPVVSIGWTLPALLIGWGLLVRARWGTLLVLLLLFMAAQGAAAAAAARALAAGDPTTPWLGRVGEGVHALILVLALAASRLARR